MTTATEQPVLVNSRLERIDVEELIESCRKDPNRILADDEVGLVVYVGDLDVHTVSGLGNPLTGDSQKDREGRWVQKVNQISVKRFSGLVRRQIGSVVRTLASDSIFIIREEEKLRKVKAKDLKPGMILHTGEKVYW